MPELNEMLKPTNGENSVKEASIVLFLTGEIIKPERFSTLINDKFKNEFQNFEPLNQVEFGITNVSNNLESIAPKVFQNRGFRFTKYKDGAAVNVLQGVNEDLRNYISFHSLRYQDWQTEFFPDFVRVIKILAEFHSNLFSKSISLHYIDEFLWEGESEINLKKIFNAESTLLPKEFFSSVLNNYVFSTLKQNKIQIVDRLEIRSENRPNQFLTISHNSTQILEDVISLNDLVADNGIRERLEIAHSHNKETLLNLLTPEVRSIIHLK